jgi:CBS domain-containing protein
VASERLSHDQVLGLTVAEVMMAQPKTVAADVLVGDVRQMFEHPSIRTVLLAQDGAFCGAIERDLIPEGAGDEEPAARYADPAPVTVTPAMAMPEAIELLHQKAEPRLIVLDEDGSTLRGLLCFNRSSGGFCVR